MRPRQHPLLHLLRPHQWLKNGFVVLPFLFARRLANPMDLGYALLALVSFCLASSCVYAINDVHDAKQDRMHPRKRLRPVASGALRPAAAMAAGTLCLASAVLLGLPLGADYLLVLCAYLVLNVAYTLRLKELAGVDILCIATGFALRVAAGSAAARVAPSLWLLALTFLLALFLALAKRREELMVAAGQGEQSRTCLSGYTLKRINAGLALGATLICAGYTMYTLSPHVRKYYGSDHLYLTMPFVAFGCGRYLWLVFVRGEGGSPARTLLADRWLQACVLVWLATFAFIIYR